VLKNILHAYNCQVEDLCKEKESSAAEIAQVQREAAQLEVQRAQLEKEMREHMPVQKVKLRVLLCFV
jgi:hypothetical protein